jgi:hypothetical protein
VKRTLRPDYELLFMATATSEMGNGEWGMGNGNWALGIGHWVVGY